MQVLQKRLAVNARFEGPWFVGRECRRWRQSYLTLLEPQSRIGDKPLNFHVVCPQNGTAVLKGLATTKTGYVTLFR